MESMGTRLRALRDQRGWTQKETAKELGLCTKCAIGQFERRERNPSPKTLQALADLFEVTPAWLLTGSDEPVVDEAVIEIPQADADTHQGFRIKGKPKDRYPVSLYPTTVARVKRVAKENGVSVAEAFDQIVEYALANMVE